MNTDRLQTILGVAKGVIVAIIDVLVEQTAEGINWKSPVFWVALIYGVIEAVKGYFGAGVKPA